MKSILFFLLLSTFSLLPFVTFSSTFTSDNPIVLPTTTTNENGFPVPVLPEVLDINGKGIQIGAKYHIVSSIRGAGGGGVYFTPLKHSISGSFCPMGVAQHGSDLQDGMPVKFFTISPGPPPFNVVRETNDINIMFSIPTFKLCVNETVWKVADPDPMTRGKRFIVSGGSIGNPGPDTISSWFMIEKVSRTAPFYKLRYCPSQFVCKTCRVRCQDVGVTIEKGERRLFLADDLPFTVYFKKV